MADSVAEKKTRFVKTIRDVLTEAQTRFHGLHVAEFTPVIELKPNTDYLIQLENNSGGAQDISIIFDFFEVAP